MMNMKMQRKKKRNELDTWCLEMSTRARVKMLPNNVCKQIITVVIQSALLRELQRYVVRKTVIVPFYTFIMIVYTVKIFSM